MLVVVRIVAMPRMIIAMMMGVPGNDLVGMFQFHRDTRSQHVNERDHDNQKSLENAAHFRLRSASNGCLLKRGWRGDFRHQLGRIKPNVPEVVTICHSILSVMGDGWWTKCALQPFVALGAKEFRLRETHL